MVYGGPALVITTKLIAKAKYFPWIATPIFIWWLICYPGYFSPDSTGVFIQVQSGEWDNWHTTLYVGWFWLTSLGGAFPQLVTLSQALLLALSISIFVDSIESYKPENLKLNLALMAFASLPQVSGFAITAWKDVPYAAAILILGSTVTDWIEPFGRRTSSWRWPLALLGVAGLRWNGALMGLGSIFIRAIMTSSKTKILRDIFLGLVALAIGVATLLAPAATSLINGVGWLFFNSGKLHDLAVLEQRGLLDDEITEILVQVMPRNAWTHAGQDCHSHDQLLFADLVNNAPKSYENLAMSERAIENAWLSVAVAHPLDILQIRACRAESSILPWSTGPSLPPGLWFTDNLDKHELTQARVLPAATDFLNSLTAFFSTNPIIQWLMLRAPVWLIVGSIFHLIRSRFLSSTTAKVERTYLLFAATICLSAAAGSVAQDLRYTMPATLLLQIFVLVKAFTKGESK